MVSVGVVTQSGRRFNWFVPPEDTSAFIGEIAAHMLVIETLACIATQYHTPCSVNLIYDSKGAYLLIAKPQAV